MAGNSGPPAQRLAGRAMSEPWRNWSGSIAFTPARFERPRDAGELARVVADAHRRGGHVRVVGAGHSSSEILIGEDTLVSLEHFRGVVSSDRAACEATVRSGSTLADLGTALYLDDLALPNYGDVATQTIGGAIGTGTHGTGHALQNLSQLMLAATLVTGRGEIRRIGRDELDVLRAARVSLGTLGVFTDITLKLVPAFEVERREYATTSDQGLAHLDQLIAENRSFDFYWYPRRDDMKLRLVNPGGGGTASLPYARELERTSGYGHQVIPTHSGIPQHFEESEFALPAENGVACFQAVRARVKQRWRATVGWRVLYRTIAADDAYLSPAHGRATVSISLHQNASLPWREFFADIAPIFLAHDGRPHWAKKHSLRAAEIAPRYPQWHAFHRVRAALDPDGVFLTPHLRELLGVDPP